MALLEKATLDSIKLIQKRLGNTAHCGKEWKFCGKELRSGILRYKDPDGKEFSYEMVERTGRCEDVGVDAADIITLVSSGVKNSTLASSGFKKLCLVAVYRPPVGKISLEFPSGYIELGETVMKGAERELLEETGYSGRIEYVSPAVYTDPWKSTENTALCVAKVDSAKKKSQLELDEDEFLEPLELPLQDLRQQLDILQRDHGFIVDVKLYAFAMGLEIHSMTK